MMSNSINKAEWKVYFSKRMTQVGRNFTCKRSLAEERNHRSAQTSNTLLKVVQYQMEDRIKRVVAQLNCSSHSYNRF